MLRLRTWNASAKSIIVESVCRCAVSTGDEDKRSETNCQLWLTALRQDHQALTSITDGTKTRFIVPDGALFFLSY
jgi:hypothetical protein